MHESVGKIRTRIAQPHESAVAMGSRQLRQRRPTDRIGAGRQPVEQHAEAVEIAPDGCRTAGENLRREIERRSRHLLAVALGLEIAAGAEVHQDDPAALFAHHVGGLDVAMHEPGCVNRREGAAQVEPDERRFARRKRPVLLEDVLEREPADELHPQADTTLDRLRPVDGDDVGMRDAREQPPFGEELRRHRFGAGALAQELQSDIAVERRVAREVDVAERSAAHATDHDELCPPRPRLQRSRGTLRLRRSGADAMKARDGVNQLELFEQLEVVAGVGGARERPVDVAAAGHRVGDVEQPLVGIHRAIGLLILHDASRLPAGAARG